MTPTLLTGMFAALASFAPLSPTPVDIEEWKPHVGDQLFVNTEMNEGFIVHPNGQYIRFPVATGQNRWVYYIGRYYKATTPNWRWEVQSVHKKGDRITYGPTGRFFRLYKDGHERTAYGIHGHRDIASVLQSDDRYYSMGCILVDEQILDVIGETYALNNQTFTVTTVFGDPFTKDAS